MGLCNSKSTKQSQTYSKQSTTQCITPIIHKKTNIKKYKKITFCDVDTQQKPALSEPKSPSPPPKLCYSSSNRSFNKDIQFGQLRTPKEKYNQVALVLQSKQTLFGKTIRFSNSVKRGQRVFQ
ncbi:unnamed protein product (macronuclear) [Paramecium tetraurelia]|uniref:Uncharacterized protein n=1 Tax=Paramecium tetraurelia TaxID=5888 RepID=A0E446_PARTE|nr:uncharacterized protein GSPATT00023236001 [Paramecium tetraurelia]CAK90063.1 unnamed protein product [Paramecium tetraurelia]|eukprot:XP_001457460.1 hypothetical protein (macronuclear) [Paramecium tetraurelia strain d4-2]